MFILDSLMISGIRWALETTLTAAEAEMNDDTALREQLLEMEMQREMGEITDQQFAAAEADLLARIRTIKGQREGGSQPLDLTGGGAIDTASDTAFQIEASVSGDFYDPADAPHTTVVASEPHHGERIEILDLGEERSERSARSEKRTKRTKETARTFPAVPTIRTPRTPRTPRTAPKKP